MTMPMPRRKPADWERALAAIQDDSVEVDDPVPSGYGARIGMVNGAVGGAPAKAVSNGIWDGVWAGETNGGKRQPPTRGMMRPR